MAALIYKIAGLEREFEAIHRLNYQTFVEEIPQHAPNPARRLVDRFHDENVYAICLAGEELVGMVAGRCARPFSLDSKLADLDGYLPPHGKAVETRLLAVQPAYRSQPVFARLVMQLARHFRALDCDLAVISGTVRQLALYEHLGFRRFGPVVGTGDALYQPMYLTLDDWLRTKSLSGPVEPPLAPAQFLPGPVAVHPAVRRAFNAEPVSHRSPEFIASMARVRQNLCQLTGVARAAVLVGTGTLANDAVAAQLWHHGQPGLVLANGEFGERLGAHAASWKLPHELVRLPWGQPFNWQQLQRRVQAGRPAWIWAVLSETSTGMTNPASELRALCACSGAALCLDAISAIGIMQVDLQDVWLATAVSGKGLAAFPGLAMVLHDGNVAAAGAVPRYLDLAFHEESAGVPFTQSSNLVSALDRALTATSWRQKFQRIATTDAELRAGLRGHGLAPLVADQFATPGIITLAVPPGVDASRVAMRLRTDGISLACESEYLRRRNWVQVCLMGEWDDGTVARIPELLAARIRRQRGMSSKTVIRVPSPSVLHVGS